MLPKPKIVFLYSEIAGYFLACAKELAKKADVLIVRWPVNNEAPFKFEKIDSLEIVCKDNFDQDNLYKKVRDFKPTTIVCSGWMDKTYLQIVKSFRKTIPCVLTLDNHWTGSPKQRMAALASPFILKNRFTHAWVPGTPQVKFAKALGFKNISTGFYCADVDLHAENFAGKSLTKTRQFLYVGRYVKQKAIFEMWEAFLSLVKLGEADGWEMVCVGAGEEFSQKIEHPQIKHLGFIQPKDLKTVLGKKPIYILPSSFEPWGVSVQEFAIAGCPLLISEKVGAGEMFLEDGKNGYTVSPTVDSIREGMRKMMALDEDTLNNMRFSSNNKGLAYTPKLWVERLLEIKL